MNLMKNGGFIWGVLFFVLLWLIIFLHHEWTISRQPAPSIQDKSKVGMPAVGGGLRGEPAGKTVATAAGGAGGNAAANGINDADKKPLPPTVMEINIKFQGKELDNVVEQNIIPVEHTDDKHDLIVDEHAAGQPVAAKDTTSGKVVDHKADEAHQHEHHSDVDLTTHYVDYSLYRHDAKRGVLICDGKPVDSEIIYWKIVPGDNEYESPITPHHGLHHDRYLSFEYDNGGWNNIRMGLESLMVVAHAMGRTLVVPPQQHLYLLYHSHKDPHDQKAHAQMGFEDFFDIELLRHHKGFHLMHMEEFLEKEAVTGGLKGIYPPNNSTKLWGRALWQYMNNVADITPSWQGRFVAFPKEEGDHDMSVALKDSKVKERLEAFGGGRSAVFYDDTLQSAHHIHFPGHESFRLLQHHYAFAFFADPEMQSYYKRFVRDYMRYKDNIQCAGAELVRLVREDAKKSLPASNGDYYALHIRRGDFQFKEVKHSAEEIIKHLHFPNGTAIIPPGSFVYISTDDPDGICKDCLVMRKPCKEYQTPKPPGCPEDTTWNAFTKFGWQIRFMRDYLKQGHLKDTNPNTHGMIESIVCSRAKVFAGTYFSTFTGYIHRLRGFHGLGEQTYYHSKNYVFNLQHKKSKGSGFSREWRTGWTDDGMEQLL